MISKRFRKAEAVLAVFEAMYHDQCEASARCYSNCREQGFVLSLFSWEELRGGKVREYDAKGATGVSVAFSEHRSSDSIVLYTIPGFTENLTDESYLNARSFKHDDYVGAAKAIWKILTNKSNRLEKKA